MPDFTTHHLVGQQVIMALPAKNELASLIRKYEDVFSWGCQGPDLLYFYRPWQPSRKVPTEIGSKLHKFSGEKTLSLALEYVNSRKDEWDYELLQVYLAGFICHYSVDSTLHPYIYFLQERIKETTSAPAIVIHASLERDLDTILYRQYYLTPVAYLKFRGNYYMRKHLDIAVTGFYNYLARELLGEGVDRKQITACFKQSHFVNRMLYPSNAVISFLTAKFTTRAAKRSDYFPKAEESFGVYKGNIELLNQHNSYWHNINEPLISYDYSLWELLDQSKKMSLNILNRNFEDTPFAGLDTTFHNGKPKKEEA